MKRALAMTSTALSVLLAAGSLPFAAAAAEVDHTDSTGSSTATRVIGDVNGDGSINVSDVTEIQRQVAELITLTGDNLTAADVNGDGSVTIDDATVMQKYLAEMEVTSKIGEAIATETEVTGDEWKENTGVITLSNSGITVTGEGITVEGNIVTITEGGDWEVIGTCDNGMIYVNTGEEKDVNDKVKLRLNGMSLTYQSGPAIYFDRCKKAFITLESGTTNTVTDSSVYDTAYADAKGAIQSDDTLEIKGKGALTVSGNYKHGISGSDDIVIENGVFNITSVKDGLHANDDITLSGKSISLTVNAQGDGMESEGTVNVEKATLNLSGAGKGINAAGDITLTSGTYIIDTTDDCINGNAAVNISDGSFDLTSGDEAVTGDTINISGGTYTLTTTGKGVKATADLNLSGGSFTINSTDDSLHSNGNITVTGGSYEITSGDDGMHADSTLTIENGVINIYQSYEGVEGNDVVINGGTVYAVASDDGINAAGGADQSSMGGRPGQNQFRPGQGGASSSSNSSITVNGGYVYVVASGDGIDSNGTLNFNGGTVVVQGPASGGNFSVDADGTVGFNGGTVLAVCTSSAMWEDISGKLGNAVMNKSAGSVSNNGVIAVTDSSGNVIAAIKSRLSGNVGVLCYSSTATPSKAVVGGSYNGSFDSYGYASGGTVSGGTSSTLSQSTSGGYGPGGGGGRW